MVRRHTDYAPVMVRVTGTRRRREIVHLHSPGSGSCRVETDVVVLLFPACGGVRREQALARLCTRRIPLRGALSKIARIRLALHGRPHMQLLAHIRTLAHAQRPLSQNDAKSHVPLTQAHTRAHTRPPHSFERHPPLQPRRRHARRRSPAARLPLRCPWRCAIVSRAPRLQGASSARHRPWPWLAPACCYCPAARTRTSARTLPSLGQLQRRSVASLPFTAVLVKSRGAQKVTNLEMVLKVE